MAQVLANILLCDALTAVVIPIACLFATPVILLRPVFSGVNPQEYWRVVASDYRHVVRQLFFWGTNLLSF